MRKAAMLVAALVALGGCGGHGQLDPGAGGNGDAGDPDGGSGDAGQDAGADAGADGGIDAGADAGTDPDAGQPDPDGGTPDAGTNPLITARPYHFHVPPGYSPGTPAPLLLMFHGYGSTGAGPAYYP